MMIAIGGLRVGGDAWNDEGGVGDIEALARKVSRAIGQELEGFGS
jgi:hypothetical protein